MLVGEALGAGSDTLHRLLQLAQKAATANAELFLPEIKRLSDAELAAELKAYGFTGPVVASTRSVYERKLATFKVEVSPE